MPFTFSHPAIVLPLYNKTKWFSFTGLAVGSLSPDFEYYFYMKTVGLYGHSFWGMFFLNLPLSLLVAYLFHCIIRNPLISQSPKFIYARFYQYFDFDWHSYVKQHWFIVISSIMLGSLSHTFWDAFTHKTSDVVHYFTLLQNNLVIGEWKYPIYNLLQHVSSVLGLIAIIVFILRLPAAKVEQKAINLSYWVVTSVCTMTILIIRMYIWHFTAMDLLVSGIMALFIALIISSLWVRTKEFVLIDNAQ